MNLRNEIAAYIVCLLTAFTISLTLLSSALRHNYDNLKLIKNTK
jgi:hypothetical protein